MTKEQARRIVGNQPPTCLRNMCRALSMHSWNNTPEEWRRLHACYVVLRVPHHKRLTIPA